ncbi:MAG: thioredoxin domain-containing protein [Nitrosopumilus sp. B06]|nr:MAG: thioredoxin domain-containing protein [Nitrosopumilus sp. B06]
MTANALIDETSPYLLQHAHNPVEWHPWNADALKKAQELNRPIFLSIGYSACHWCHVMAHESFEDKQIAEFMNANFVNIKVDREERPDLDDVYQKACQMATGQGGWPLSVFLTPDQRPFFAGTYFPPLDMHGRPGFGSLCRRLSQAWREKPRDVEKSAQSFVDALQKTEPASSGEIDRTTLDEAAMNLLQMGDSTYGGFGSAPKFPNTACISFLFRYSDMTGMARFGGFAQKTLKKMARGGIFDQIGGGFHRYSTDSRWLVPHFEKMLYDNALIPVNYAEAYQVTGDSFYLDVMKKTLDFVLREMRDGDGGFYSAYDADSEGSEGTYYTWKKSEIKVILGDDADLFCLYHDVTDGGNWEGRSILCNNLELSAVAFHCGVSEGIAKEILESCSKKLLEARSHRPMPGLDAKILVSWNALMVTALAKGYRVSRDQRYIDAAMMCLDFIRKQMYKDGRLFHAYKDGSAKIGGYLEDYAYLANALLDVFEISSDPRHLQWALDLGRVMAEDFWDSGNACFFMTSHNHEQLIVRPRNSHDLSLPSGNSVAALAMIRLHHLAGATELEEIARRAVKSQARAAAENPFGFGYMLCVMSLFLHGPEEILVLNTENQDICRFLYSRYLPNSLLLTVDNADNLRELERYPFFAGKLLGEKTEVFVCRDFACSAPINTMQEIKTKFS